MNSIAKIKWEGFGTSMPGVHLQATKLQMKIDQ